MIPRRSVLCGVSQKKFNYNNIARALRLFLLASSVTVLFLTSTFGQSLPPTMADDEAGEQAYMSYLAATLTPLA